MGHSRAFPARRPLPGSVPVISFKHFVTTAFTDLSLTKRWMLRGSVLLLLVGGGAKAFSTIADADFGSGEWTWTSIMSGVGWIGGFLIGALLRIFLKLSLLAAFIAAGVTFGLSKLGVIDMEFSEFSNLASAYAERAKEQLSGLQTFLEGFLPASMASGVGVASGVTQKPDWTPDNDD